jgi:citrate lyase synthetase
MINERVHNSCLGCTDRYVGCHSKCEKYKTYKEEMTKLEDIVNKKKKKYSGYVEYKYSKMHLER